MSAARPALHALHRAAHCTAGSALAPGAAALPTSALSTSARPATNHQLAPPRRYRRLHSHEVTVAAQQLQCSGELAAETQGLLAMQLQEERADAAMALDGRRPPPLFLASGGSKYKRCRASPKGSEHAPRLHRVALITPEDQSGMQWALGSTAGREQWRRRRQLRQQQAAAASLATASGIAAGVAVDPQQQAAQQTQQQDQAQQQQQWQFLRLEGSGGAQAATSQQHNVLGAGSSSSGRASADISIVTQLSIDRLPSLLQQCASWAGPTVAVVYAPLVAGRLAGLEGVSDAEAAALEGGTPVDALQHIRAFYRRIAEQGERGAAGPAGVALHGAGAAQRRCVAGRDAPVLRPPTCRLLPPRAVQAPPAR